MAKTLLDMDRLPTMEELKEFFKKSDLFSAKPLLWVLIMFVLVLVASSSIVAISMSNQALLGWKTG